MFKPIVIAVAIMALAGGILIGVMHYAGSGPVNPNMQVNCRGGEGGQIVAIADHDCTFIGTTLAAAARQSQEKTRGPLNSTAVALGGTAGREIFLNPLPQAIKERTPSIAHHHYFIEGNDIALVELPSRRVVVKIDIQQSKAVNP